MLTDSFMRLAHAGPLPPFPNGARSRRLGEMHYRVLRGAAERLDSGLSLALCGLEIRDHYKIACGLERIRQAADDIQTVLDRLTGGPTGPLAARYMGGMR